MSKTSEEEKKGPAGSVRGGGGVPGLGDKLRWLSWKILSLLPGEYRMYRGSGVEEGWYVQ